MIETVNYELTNRDSEMWQTWGEYIDSTLQRVNDQNAKSLVLFLNQHNERYYTPRELKKELHLELAVNDIHRQLLTLVDADLLKQGTADIDFSGLQDGTLNLILRNRFEKEIREAGQTILPAFLSLGGFTAEALAFCTQFGIATAEQINYEWLAEP